MNRGARFCWKDASVKESPTWSTQVSLGRVAGSAVGGDASRVPTQSLAARLGPSWPGAPGALVSHEEQAITAKAATHHSVSRGTRGIDGAEYRRAASGRHETRMARAVQRVAFALARTSLRVDSDPSHDAARRFVLPYHRRLGRVVCATRQRKPACRRTGRRDGGDRTRPYRLPPRPPATT